MKFNNPYVTSYTRDYVERKPSDAPALKPPSSMGGVMLAARSSSAIDLTKATTYREDYNRASGEGSITARSGMMDRDKLLASCRPDPIYPPNGEKRNNPHPLKPFMIWRVPNPRLSDADTLGQQQRLDRHAHLADSDFNRALRGKLASTYQADYIHTLALRQQKQPNGPNGSGSSNNNVDDTPPLYSLASTQRNDFRRPATVAVAAADLHVPMTRYGSNVDKQRPATGAVPDVVKGSCHMTVPSVTCYVDHYCGGCAPDDVTNRCQSCDGKQRFVRAGCPRHNRHHHHPDGHSTAAESAVAQPPAVSSSLCPGSRPAVRFQDTEIEGQ